MLLEVSEEESYAIEKWRKEWKKNTWSDQYVAY